MKRIGIDVGGTNTDAVLVQDGRVQASVKAPTSTDVTTGIIDALRTLQQRDPSASDADAILIGTTHFINSVIERKHLTRVAALRIGAPATTSLPPFCDWPADLAAIVNGGSWFIEGGHDYDGREFMALDRAAIAQAARDIRARGVEAVAITAMFSPLDTSHEELVAAELRQAIPGVTVTCSHDLGGIGLLERENAAILNASLIALARRTVAGFENAMVRSGIAAPLFITQNDGTVVTAERAAELPVYSFASGPTNSMRGAAFLSGLQDAIVADVGGTTTDIGQLQKGFPRPANTVVRIGGVRTLFRMPDLISIGLGGGSLIAGEGDAIGPQSVGYRLTTEARVFGGSILTTTDVATAAGLITLGDRNRVADIAPVAISRTLSRIKAMIEEQVDRIKTHAGNATLIAVGGGSFLIPDRIAGIGEVIRVAHGDCANAVGAAIAQVSGEVDQVFQNLPRSEAIAAARELAKRKAVESGASADSLVVVETEDLPIAYLPGGAMRVKVKVVGDVSSRLVQGRAGSMEQYA
ncbi:MAG: hydantoinase/oxoprolinase N-terminal domain-containing protein [Pseudorhodoplanes sp.]